MHNKSALGSVALTAAVLIIGGCFGHAGASAEVDAPVVFAAESTLVVVEPGIWVVRDYDYSVYYVDDYYWVYRDDVWYRSRTYDRGWARAEVSLVPRSIVSRDHRAYVHYHGGPNALTRSAPRERSNDRDRRARVDERREPPPDRNRDKGPRMPEHADDHHAEPADRRPDRRPDEDRAGDRHDAAPRRDDRPGVDPHGRRNDDKREEHEKADDRQRDDRQRDDRQRDEKRKQDNDDHKRGEKRDDHDKR